MTRNNFVPDWDYCMKGSEFKWIVGGVLLIIAANMGVLYLFGGASVEKLLESWVWAAATFTGVCLLERYGGRLIGLFVVHWIRWFKHLRGQKTVCTRDFWWDIEHPLTIVDRLLYVKPTRGFSLSFSSFGGKERWLKSNWSTTK